MEARYGGTADHRGRLSVDDALAPIPAVRARLIKPLESTLSDPRRHSQRRPVMPRKAVTPR